MSNSKTLKRLHRKANSIDPLKVFAKTLEGEEAEIVVGWKADKAGLKETSEKKARDKLKGARIKAEALASKQARGK